VNEELLQRLRDINPEPSTNSESDELAAVFATINARRSVVTAEERSTTETTKRQQSWRRNAVAFMGVMAIVLLIIGGGVLLFGNAAEQVVGGEPTAEAPPPTQTVSTTLATSTTTAPTTTTLAASTNPPAGLIVQEFAVMGQQLADPAVQRWMAVMQNPFRDKVFVDVRFEIDLLDTDGNVIRSTVRMTNFILPEQEVVLTGGLSPEHEVVDARITSTAGADDVEEGSLGSWTVSDVVYNSTAVGAQGWGFNGNLTMSLEAVVTDIQVHVVMRDESGRPVWVAVGQVPWMTYLGTRGAEPWTAPTGVEVEFDSFETYVNPLGSP
jgi:hypothetical protein